jgi:hypothetical protein
MLILIIVILLLCGALGGGYWGRGNERFGYAGGGGIGLGTVLLICVIIYVLGGFSRLHL